jgi:malonate transporter MadL subunit
MIIYGVALLSFCYICGQLVGELLGKYIGVEANVGGVGFAMLLLVLINDKMKKLKKLDQLTEDGINFWSQMYIPIVVAMSAIQNVKVAVSSGLLAFLVGIIPVVGCYLVIPYLSKMIKVDHTTSPIHSK